MGNITVIAWQVEEKREQRAPVPRLQRGDTVNGRVSGPRLLYVMFIFMKGPNANYPGQLGVRTVVRYNLLCGYYLASFIIMLTHFRDGCNTCYRAAGGNTTVGSMAYD